MKHRIVKLAGLFFLICFSLQAQTSTWQIDPNHSKVGFSIPYFKVSTIDGTFNEYQGTLVHKDTSFENAKLSITLQVASIDTDQEKRDEHLLSTDFFSAEIYPEIIFESTAFKKINEVDLEITGDFTMGGITKEIILKATYKGGFIHPRFKNERRIYTIEGSVEREAHNVGVKYKPAKFALGNNVALKAQIHLIKAE